MVKVHGDGNVMLIVIVCKFCKSLKWFPLDFAVMSVDCDKKTPDL